MKTQQEIICVLETQLDDITGQEAGYLIGRLLEEGALDALCIPVLMKKGRPGFLFQVLCSPKKKKSLMNFIFEETPTFGIRFSSVKRQVLHRRIKKQATPQGSLRIKERGAKILERIPEFDDLCTLAKKNKIPLRQLKRELLKGL